MISMNHGLLTSSHKVAKRLNVKAPVKSKWSDKKLPQWKYLKLISLAECEIELSLKWNRKIGRHVAELLFVSGNMKSWRISQIFSFHFIHSIAYWSWMSLSYKFQAPPDQEKFTKWKIKFKVCDTIKTEEKSDIVFSSLKVHPSSSWRGSIRINCEFQTKYSDWIVLT